MTGRNGKKERRFNKRMQRKLTAVFAFVLLVLALLLGRITMITMTSGNRYARQVLSQQNYDSQTIPARRGEILDSNGIVLAKSDLVYNVILDCNYVNVDKQCVEPTIRAITANFGLDENRIRDILTSEKTEKSQYQVLLKGITEEQKTAFEDYAGGNQTAVFLFFACGICFRHETPLSICS